MLIFSQEIASSRYVKKNRYRLHFKHFNISFLILLTFCASLNFVLITISAIFMVSAKLVTLDLLKIKVF